jgi:NCAIR mutase (PurE)-related protein
MSPTDALTLLERFRTGQVPAEQVLQAFQAAPVVDLGFAVVDQHRALRKGFPEVIFGASKTPEQVVAIAREILAADGRVLTTRVTPEHVRALKKKFPHTVHHEAARCLTLETAPLPKRPGTIAVVAAGTTDLPVAEEAAVTADFMGNTVQRIYDVGVAGLHRLLRRLPDIQAANVVIVVAGMEAALPSVVGGLIGRPIIGVPTSVGYGSHFGGLTALLGMLNSCASGLTVVNIDNGFGAGYAASGINALAAASSSASAVSISATEVVADSSAKKRSGKAPRRR